MSGEARLEQPAQRSASTVDRYQYLMAGFLALLGVVVLVDASRIGSVVTANDPLGPKPVPILLGLALIAISIWYALDIARGGQGEEDAGEDVDLDAGTDWRTVGLLGGAFLLNAVLIEPAGWVISGTILFWLSAIALGSTRYVRALLIGLVLALATFYAFAVGLGVNLPAGILQGIL